MDSFFANTSRLEVRPTQPPVQWVLRHFPWELNGRGVKLTTHLHLDPRLRKRGATPPPHMSSWRGV